MPIVVPTSASSEKTFGHLIDEVLSSLSGYAREQEVSSALADPVSAADLAITVTNTDNLSAGIVEIGEELIWVDRVDRNTGVLTVAPWGRGFQNTPVSTHDVYEKVTFNPRNARWRIKRAINDALYGIGLAVPAAETETFVITAGVSTYELPADANGVLSARAQLAGTSGDWVPISRFDFNGDANLTDYPTGSTITLSGIPAGYTVQVVVEKDPSQLVEEDDLFTDSGLPNSCFEVAVLGACYRLVAYADAARLDSKSIEADMLDEPNPFGSSSSLSKYYFQLYSQRLEEEARRFRNIHKVRIRYSR